MQTILDTQYGSDDEATVVLYVPDYAEKPTSVPSEALLTSPQFDQFKAVEGVCKPVAMVIMDLEGQKYTTADVAWPQLVLLKHTFEAATFNAPSVWITKQEGASANDKQCLSTVNRNISRI